MRLSEYLCRECVTANLAAKDKEQAIRKLAETACIAGLDADTVRTVLLDREKMGSTAVGDGYAIPHGKIAGLESMLLVFARSIDGIAFDAPDGKPSRFFFMVLAPDGAAGQHLGLLGAIARLARDPSFTLRLSQAKDAAELADFLLTV